MIIVSVDIETTGIDPYNDEIVELGYVLWDFNSKTPIVIKSELLMPYNKFEFPKKIQELTGITMENIIRYGAEPIEVLENFKEILFDADFILVHFGILFDRLFLLNAFKRLKIPFPKKLWIDTSIDLFHPVKPKSLKLEYLTEQRGIRPLYPHRAVFDAISTFQLLENLNSNFIFNRANEKILKIDTHFNYEERDIAKNEGFYWNPSIKFWQKIIREGDLDKHKKRKINDIQVVYNPANPNKVF